MVTDPKARTIYDDWKARRQRLADASTGAAGYQAVEMRLLDYLLRRYEASPEVARPARFPLPLVIKKRKPSTSVSLAWKVNLAIWQSFLNVLGTLLCDFAAPKPQAVQIRQ